MEHLDALAKILAVAGSFLLGMRWVVNRIESGPEKLRKGQQKLRKELSSKVDLENCRRFRSLCAPPRRREKPQRRAG
ncbi:MAG: hypothetical protein J6S54_08260 [Lentisphaeria bacterium]|nr:hypothetical protein [Lentisphaeria bacterium]